MRYDSYNGLENCNLSESLYTKLCVPNLLLLPSERHALVGLKQEVVLRSAVDDMTSGCT
jgi:hypothetical protein